MSWRLSPLSYQHIKAAAAPGLYILGCERKKCEPKKLGESDDRPDSVPYRIQKANMAMFRNFLKLALWNLPKLAAEQRFGSVYKKFGNQLWEWNTGESGVPVRRIPELWHGRFGEGHGFPGHDFPFQELGGTREEDVESIITRNCGDIARVSDAKPPLLFPPAQDAPSVPSAEASVTEVFIHINVDRRRNVGTNIPSAGAPGVPEKRGAMESSGGASGGGQKVPIVSDQMVSDQKAANTLKKSKVDSQDRDATKMLMKIGEKVSGENLVVMRTGFDAFLANIAVKFEATKVFRASFGPSFLPDFAERCLAHRCPCSFCADVEGDPGDERRFLNHTP